MSMKDRKYLLFKKAYRTTLENTIEIKTDMQKEYETYRVEYTVQWSTILPYKEVHDRLIRVLFLLLRKARMDTRIKEIRR